MERLRREMARLAGIFRSSRIGKVPDGPIPAEELVKELTRERSKTEEPVYVLRGPQRISGKLDLKHRTVEVAVDIQDCEFLEEVDLRYCEFKQAVNLSGCTFNRRFQSGDEIESHTIYRKDLICNKCRFAEETNFNGVRVGGSAYFHGAHFELKAKEESANPSESHYTVSFVDSSFSGQLSCWNTVFKGPANFDTVKCGGSGLFVKASFEREANFPGAYFGGQLVCNGAIFQGLTIFNTLKCDGTGIFSDNVKFQNGGVDFGHASFGMNLICNGATFEDQADFDSLNCGLSGFFHNATFKKGVNFNHASFGKNLGCDGATFQGPATFRSLECGNSGLFRNARFGGEADLGFATFGGDLECKGEQTVFEKRASFNRVKCEGSGRFEKARFLSVDKKNDFVLTHFGINLSFESTHFAGPVDLWIGRVGQALILTAACFEQTVALSGATIGQLEVKGETLPFTRGNLLTRGCSFARFIGDESAATHFVEAQDPTEFSRDPYLQLERYYSKIGDDVQATQMYRKGRIAHLKNAVAANTSTHWSQGHILEDWFLRVSIGIADFLLILAALHFLRPDVNPVSEPISTYAVGPYDFLLTAADIGSGLAALALMFGLYLGIAPPGRSYVGLFLLGLYGVSELLAGIFPIDVGGEATTFGTIHNIVGNLSFFAFPIAVILLSFGMGKDERWRSFRRPALAMSLAVVLTVILTIVGSNIGLFGVT